jgi:hypothetical protein
MSILEEFHKHPERVLDRLVDGELSPTERRGLLSALDDEPSGWRRCALAFLEAQTFRWQFSRMAAEESLSHSTDDVLAGARSGRSSNVGRNWWGMCLAVAASLLVAFALGTRFPTGSSSASAPEQGIATQTPAPTNAQVASAEPTIDQAEAGGEPSETPLQSVTLALGEGDGADRIELPVASADADTDAWLEDLQATVPASLLERLKEAGFEVVRHQRFYPVELSDGRRLVVPVEQVDIRDPGAPESL